jgi:hypothetical protein
MINLGDELVMHQRCELGREIVDDIGRLSRELGVIADLAIHDRRFVE